MRNSVTRRYKPSPLQVWKEQYKYIAELIRTQKHNDPDREWGKFKRARNQSRIEFLRQEARTLLAARPAAAQAARKLWEDNKPLVEA